jgi:hypothetical protein
VTLESGEAGEQLEAGKLQVMAGHCFVEVHAAGPAYFMAVTVYSSSRQPPEGLPRLRCARPVGPPHSRPGADRRT